MNRLVLIVVLLCTLFTFTYASLEFNLVTDAAPWSPRQRANLVTLTSDVYVDRDLAMAKGTIVLLGGDDPSGRAWNDIWISNNGYDWQFIAGRTPDGVVHPLYGTSAFQPNSASTSNVHPTNSRIYKVAGGTDRRDVYYTDNVVEWTTSIVVAPEFQGRTYPGVAVDSTGRLIIAGGFRGNQGLSDVWISDDAAMTLQQVNGFSSTSNYAGFGGAPWAGNTNGNGAAGDNMVGGRGSLDFESWKNPVHNKDVLFLWTGSAQRKVTFNDVWVSADSGASWLVVCKAAPWVARNDDTGGITPNGILVVTAGRPAANANNQDQPDLNDVWASLDGGYTWGQCSSAAEFPDRRYVSSTFDSNGYYYVMAGLNGTAFFNDVWKSSFSFNDVDAVASHCNLTVPACGVGLVCFPGESTFDSNGMVTCPLMDTCKSSSSSASSNSGAVAALAVLFVISTLIAAYALYYIWKSKKSQNSGHINSGDSLGSMSDGNSLYKPLTIHS